MYRKNKRKTKISDFDFSKICRSCLTERGHLKYIFSSSIEKMIEFCMSTQISDIDDLPKQICVACFHQIAKFYHFKKRFEKIDRILRNHVKRLKDNTNDNSSDAVDSENGEELDVLNTSLNKSNAHKCEDEVIVTDAPKSTNKKIGRKNISKEVVSVDNNNKNNVENQIQEQAVQYKFKDKKDSAENKEFSLRNIPTENQDANHCITEEVVTDDMTPIFTDGPPPLVPLPTSKSSHLENVSFENNLKNLPQDTPPLVPIKPISVLDRSTIPNALINVTGEVIELKGPFQCSICSEMFSTLPDLKQHQTLSCKTASLHCNICKKKFYDPKRLIGHLKGHMVTKDYECQLCGKRYPNPSTFRVHMRTHTGERPFKCQICNKGFTRYAGVIGHMRTHSPEKPYQCSTCGRCFKVLSNLERHKAIHMESMPFSCNYCGKSFSQSDNLNLHIRSCHTHERPFLCSECGKGFVSSNRLNRHMWVHTGYKPYKCKCCSKAYTNSNDLKNHQRTHLGGPTPDEKPFACSLCNMRFFHRCRLTKHMKVHDKRFACEDCFKVFTSEALLNRHRGRHKVGSKECDKPVTYPIEVFIV